MSTPRPSGDPVQLALLRVGLGVLLLWLFSSPAYDYIIGLHQQGMGPHQYAGSLLPEALIPWTVEHFEALRLAGMICAGAFALGLLTPLAGLGALAIFLLTEHLWFKWALFHGAWLYVPVPLLFVALAARVHPLSLDRLVTRRAEAPPAWPAEFATAFLGFVYLAAGVQKVVPLEKAGAWLEGTTTQMVANVFAVDSPLYAMLDGLPFAYNDHQWPWALASIATVILEIGGGLLLMASAFAVLAGRRMLSQTAPTRVALGLSLYCMHQIIFLLGIPVFPKVTLALFVPLLWYPLLPWWRARRRDEASRPAR